MSSQSPSNLKTSENIISDGGRSVFAAAAAVKVDKANVTDTLGPEFKSSHWQFYYIENINRS